MTADSVSTFLATGAILLGVGLALLVVLVALSTVSGRARDALTGLSYSFDGLGTKVAFSMATIAMAGSLYYSEVVGFVPCEYCWYQRIAMYPLVPILGVALLTRDRSVRKYALPIASIGALIAAYHYTIQHFPNLSVGECSLAVPCTAAYVWKFDFVSIPFMALMSFGVIIAVLILDRHRPDVDDVVETTDLTMEGQP
jgi:disulfide bond formation protein DsbB